jgi:hypothetical protein
MPGSTTRKKRQAKAEEVGRRVFKRISVRIAIVRDTSQPTRLMYPALSLMFEQERAGA